MLRKPPSAAEGKSYDIRNSDNERGMLLSFPLLIVGAIPISRQRGSWLRRLGLAGYLFLMKKFPFPRLKGICHDR
jgi:hypothetical protein